MNNVTFDDILSKYDESIIKLALQLRALVLAQLPGVIEQPDAPANIIGYGYGAGYKDSICAFIPSKKGLKLGFYKGSELPDPTQLLTGSGKVHKHAVITNASDIKNPALKQLLKSAHAAWVLRSRVAKEKKHG